MNKVRYQKNKWGYYFCLIVFAELLSSHKGISSELFDNHSIEEITLVRQKRANLVKENLKSEQPKKQVTGAKRDLKQYFINENPELLEKASKALPKNIPLSWYCDL